MIMPIITLRHKRIIVDIDTQKHFFLDRGTSCIRNHREVLANIRRIVTWGRLKNIRMISTVWDEGPKKISYTLRNRYRSFDATDCTDLPTRILEQYDQVIFHKRCLDPFEEPRADRMLSELEADEFILIGVLTEGAVKATALGLLARRKNVTVLVDAIGSRNNGLANTALRCMWAKGASITDTKTLLSSSCLRMARLGLALSRACLI